MPVIEVCGGNAVNLKYNESYQKFREEVRDVETLEVVLEDDGWAELLLDAATRGTLRKAMGLLAAKAEADDAAFFWGDD